VRAVSNAGPIIHLSWVDRLDLLEALFQEVLVPAAVRDEILPARRDVRGVPAIRSAFTSDQLKVRAVTDRGAVAGLESYLHRGEAEAIVLMRETAADLLLLDDKEARLHAQTQGLPISGTIGVLRMARELGLIQSVPSILNELKRLGFRISEALVETIQREEEARYTG
jgi:predicted nucleic acid-binding protein